mgnify:CR=1 FL=1
MKLTRPLVALDLETTGVDPATARIVEVGLVRVEVDGSSPRWPRHWTINPGCAMPPEAVAIHGITDADVFGCPAFADVAAEIAEALTGCDLVVYNGRSLDLPLLRRELALAGVAWPLDGARILDPYVIYRERVRHTLGDAVRLYLDHEHVGAHGAVADAAATLDVMLAQVERYADLAGMDLDALAKACDPRKPHWATEQGHIHWSADGEAVYGFGRHAGKRLADERRYAGWIVGENFPADVKTLCSRAARGESVRRPAESP